MFTLKSFDAEGEQIGLGSGFAIPGNRLVTNAHVVADAAWIEILDQQGRMVSTAPYATLLDLDSDLAVLPLPGEGFAVIGLADDAASTGDDVWAFGAPLGLEGTVSRGIVSARRDRDGKSFLQITAPISQGSSGGPVVNDSGEIVGVVVAMMSEGQNLNFAVDVSELRQLLSVPAARLRFPSSQSLVRQDDELDDDVKVA
ncbi:MAG: trypsin-like peptidase domain-containing protein, partial [Alcanivoracaceae bacterium]|nr:trypsin-like peptidase domain-containing protein [Alcanivoracaceae bacterium]